MFKHTGFVLIASETCLWIASEWDLPPDERNFNVGWQLACVAGIRKGRGRELGRETAREGGGRRGTPANKPLFSPFQLLIKKYNKSNATMNDYLSNKSGHDACILVLFFALIFFCFPKMRNLKWRYYKNVQMRSSVEGIFLESCNEAGRVT